MITELKEYIMPVGDTILYHPTESFPPGFGTIGLGSSASSIVTRIIEEQGNQASAINILDLGTGPGTFLASLFPFLHDKNLNLTGIDIDPLSARLAKLNLNRLKNKYRASRIDLEIKVADWEKDQTWRQLPEHIFHLIFFNPPYYGPEHDVPSRLAVTRTDLYSTADFNGLSHYLTVFPNIPRILSRQKGSSFIARLPGDEFMSNDKFWKLVEETARKIDTPVWIFDQHQLTADDVKGYLTLQI